MRPSELILNSNGSVYHLHLLPEQIAHNIITVGDPDRVVEVSKRFDRVTNKVAKREFVTHTGWLNGKQLSVISTGIGTDNIDIVFNELDALVNIDLKSREVKDELTSLNIIRIGTSGALRPELGVDSFLASSGAIGLEGLMHYYERNIPKEESELLEALTLLLCESKKDFPIKPYYAAAADELVELFAANGAMHRGITLTATGFYAPQGRELRLKSRFSHASLDLLVGYEGPNGQRLTNLEMETAGIYGMAQLLGHRAVSLNALLANRATGTFSKQPGKTVDQLIDFALERLTEK